MFFKKAKNENVEEDKSNDKSRAFLRKAGVFGVRYFDALVAVFIMIIFISSFFFVINPKYKAIAETEEYSQDDLEAEKKKLSGYLAKLNEYRDTYQKLSSESIARVEKVVPQGDFLENFFARIETIAKRQGVLITSLSVKDPDESEEEKNKKGKVDKDSSKPDGLGVVEIVLELTGIDYPGVKKIVTVLENNLRLMDIKFVKFDTSQKSAEFTISSYFLKQ